MFCILKDFSAAVLNSETIVNKILIITVLFYCATIAYHVGLNAISGGRRTPANDQEKWTFAFDGVHVLLCTIAVSFGDSSSSRWPPYWKAFEISLNIFTVFFNFQLFASFYYIDY